MNGVIPGWSAVSIGYFGYVAALAVLRPGLAPRARRLALGAAATGGLLSVAGAFTSQFWLRDVLLPPLLLLLGYWSSGLFWTGPMPRAERALAAVDRATGVLALATRFPRLLGELLELAYASVYPLIPLALVLHLWLAASPHAERFWTVILATDYVCFAMLPWIQTRPPRMLDPQPAPPSALRAFNLRLLGHASIGVNTVPSGHAAEAVAVALLLADAPALVSAGAILAAAAISAGAVFGRYHYAVDVAAGWIVALLVWVLVPGVSG